MRVNLYSISPNISFQREKRQRKRASERRGCKLADKSGHISLIRVGERKFGDSFLVFRIFCRECVWRLKIQLGQKMVPTSLGRKSPLVSLLTNTITLPGKGSERTRTRRRR